MNREQREGYEQRLQRTLLFNPPVEIQTQTLEGSPVVFSQGLDTLFFSFLEQQGTLPFLFAVFACFAVRMTTNTLDEKHEPRTTRTTRTWRSKPIQTFAGFAQPPVVGWEREKTLLLHGI